MATLEDLLLSDDSDDEVDPSIDIGAIDLEEILKSAEGEDEDEEPYQKVLHNYQQQKASSSTTPAAASSSSSSLSVKVKEENNIVDLLNSIRISDSLPPADSVVSSESAAMEDRQESCLKLELEDVGIKEEEQEEQEIDSLRLAEERERRGLLQTDPPPTTLRARRQPASSSSGNGGGSGGDSEGTGGSSGAALIQLDRLPLVSHQLQRNLSYQMHGPGSGSALCISTHYLAIGTNKGYVIIFDHKQEIRRVLNPSSPSTSSSSMPGGSGEKVCAVTALDALVDGSFMVAGYQSGEILCWDVTKGSLAKQHEDPSHAPILAVHFLYSVSGTSGGGSKNQSILSFAESDAIVFLVRTATHCINRYKWTKSLLGSWHLEMDCLLETSREPVLSSACLLPLPSSATKNKKPAATSSSSPAKSQEGQAVEEEEVEDGLCRDLSQHPVATQFFAFALPTMAVVVQLLPEVKILHKWLPSSPSSPGELEQTSSNEATKEVAGGEQEVLLEWTWLFLPVSTAAEQTNCNEDDSVSSAAGRNGESKLNKRILSAYYPVLTRATGRRVDLLSMRVDPFSKPSSRPSSLSGASTPLSSLGSRASLLRFAPFSLQEESSTLSPPSFSFSMEASVELPAGRSLLGLKWLDGNELLVFTAQEISLFDQNLRLLERVALAPLLTIPVSSSSLSVPAQDRPLLHVWNQKVYLVLPTEVWMISSRSAFEQVNALITQGRYIEGLALVLDTVEKSPSLLQLEREVVQKYILNYAYLAVKRPFLSPASTSPAPASAPAAATLMLASPAVHHLSLVASVCIEYCIATKNLPLLYYEVLEIFRAEGQEQVVIAALEPFFLSQALPTMPPAIIQAFLTYALRSNKIKTIERSILFFHLDSLDLNMICRFLFQYKLFSSFLYIYSEGLGDVLDAFAHVFSYLTWSTDNLDLHGETVSADADVGYKLLLFLLYISEDKVFPRGLEKVYDGTELLALLERVVSADYVDLLSLVPNDQKTDGHAAGRAMVKDMKWPYLTYFARLDGAALFHVLKKAIEKTYTVLSQRAKNAGGEMARLTKVIATLHQFSLFMDRQGTLLSIRLEALLWEKLHLSFFSFHLLAQEEEVIRGLVRYCQNRPTSQHEHYETLLAGLAEDQSKLLSSSALEAKGGGVANGGGSLEEMFRIFCDATFYLAALSIRTARPLETDYRAAVTFYLSLDSHKKPLESSSGIGSSKGSDKSAVARGAVAAGRESSAPAFDYLDSQYSYLLRYQDTLHSDIAKGYEDKLNRAVVGQMASLAAADLFRAARLTRRHLLPHLSLLLEQTKTNNKLQFQLLSTILNKPKKQAEQEEQEQGVAVEEQEELPTSALLTTFFTQHDLLYYLHLYSVYQPFQLLSFLQEYGEYLPLDDCLALARDRLLHDCWAYLEERCGNVTLALQLLLKDISSKVRNTRREIDHLLSSEAVGLSTSTAAGGVGGRATTTSIKDFLTTILFKGLPDSSTLLLHLPCLEGLLHSLDCCLALCNRQLVAYTTSRLASGATQQEEQEQERISAFFCESFDYFLEERRLLRAGTISSSSELLAQIVSSTIRQLIASMRSVVSPQAIVLRLVQHASSTGLKLVEFRDVLVHMLESTAAEQRLGDVVNRIFCHDRLLLQNDRLKKMKSFLYKSSSTSPPAAAITPATTPSKSAKIAATKEEGVDENTEGQGEGKEEVDEEAVRRERELRLLRLKQRPTARMDLHSLVSTPSPVLIYLSHDLLTLSPLLVRCAVG